MDKPIRFRFRIISRVWIPLLMAVGFLVAWQLLRILPGWIEENVRQSMLKNGVVVTAFPIDSIGIHRTHIGPGAVLFEQHSLEWDSMLVGYRLSSLKTGNLEQLQVNKPRISLQAGALLPSPRTVYEASPDAMPPVPAVPSQDTEGIREDVDSSGGVPAVLQADQAEPGIWDHLQGIPLNRISATSGVVEILLQSKKLFEYNLDGFLEKQPYGTSGEVLIGSDDFSGHLSIRAPAARNAVTFQGEVAMRPGAVKQTGNQLIELREDCDLWPRIVSSGPFVLDLFMETLEGGPIYGSAEASIGELTILHPSSSMEISFNEMLLAGVYKENALSFEGGAEILLPSSEGFFADPFSARLSYKDSGVIQFETEAFTWNLDSLNGRCALRGYSRPSDSAQNTVRVEFAFDYLNSGAIAADAFSIMVESGASLLEAKASPVGLSHLGTLWIEDLFISHDLKDLQGKSGFSFYGLAGELLGRFAGNHVLNKQIQKLDFSLENASGEEALNGHIIDDGNSVSADIDGILSLDWINTVISWLDLGPVRFSGPSPSLNMQLETVSPLPKGAVRLTMDDLEIILSGTTRLSGVDGIVSVAVNGLPRTTGIQVTKIDRFSTASLDIRDISLSWQLHSIQQLEIVEFSGRIGNGYVRMDPVTFDPMNPTAKTTIRFEGIEGDLLRRILGEERFSLDGTVTGQIQVGYENGQLILGRGRFDLDKNSKQGKFNFEDKEFLRERFSSFGGVPEELKTRLLQSLLTEGIRIDSLEVTLGPGSDPDKLLLRIALSGESRSNELEVPIKGFVINNLISLTDMAELLGLLAPVRLNPELFR